MAKLPVDIGRLDRRITIQKKVVAQDDLLNEAETWSDYYTCWAAVSGVSNREYFAARQQHEENVVNFKVRGCTRLKDIDKINYRIVFGDHIYDINYIDDVRFSGTVFNIKAVRHVPSVEEEQA